MATWEDARRCPKCEMPGKEVERKSARGDKGQPCSVVKMECTTGLCRWYQTNYFVQINADGSIPDPESPLTRQKNFPVDAPDWVINQKIQQVNDAGLEIQELSQRGGMELR